MAFVPVELNLKWLQKTFVTRTIQNSIEAEKLQIFVEDARKTALWLKAIVFILPSFSASVDLV